MGGEDEGQDSDLGSTRPLLPSPCSRPVPSASLAPAPSLLWPASRSQAPLHPPCPQCCHGRDSMGWVTDAVPRSHGQKGGGCPRCQHLQALDQCVSTGPSIQAYPESHPQETSHSRRESLQKTPVLVQSVNVTKKTGKELKGFQFKRN